jgi:hypothetical protein
MDRPRDRKADVSGLMADAPEGARNDRIARGLLAICCATAFACNNCCTAYVRFWHKADITRLSPNVRFWG